MKQPEKYSAEPTKRTPWIVLKPGRVFIFGRSIPENPGDFYRPVHEWISRYAGGNGHETIIEFGFDYINTSSTKWIYNIVKQIALIGGLAETTRIYWYYERGDEDMCELGFILRSLVECPFLVIELDKMNRKPGDPLLTDSL